VAFQKLSSRLLVNINTPFFPKFEIAFPGMAIDTFPFERRLLSLSGFVPVFSRNNTCGPLGLSNVKDIVF